ncbi:hypothetical protein BGX29_006457 [Mortierella sp. GBA35]|nr:hypothetical protein BGX29_006457 [Mortierella sp. GBA35]
MTATTACTRGGGGGDGYEKDGGGLSPIGDGKSDMVTIYIDETPEDENRVRDQGDGDKEEVGDNDNVDEKADSQLGMETPFSRT